MEFTRLGNRAVAVVEGEDRIAFLQGLISNDLAIAAPNRSLWTGFLSPQGKFQYDLFITVHGEQLWLETEADRLDAFVKRLSLFKLRSKVTIRTAPELSVWAVWGPDAELAFGLTLDAGNAVEVGGGIAAVDPRLAAAGLRVVLPAQGAEAVLKAKGLTDARFDAWDRHRLSLGLPDGSRDMEVDGNLLLELGFEELGGVDFKKGCFMGQENTTRSKFRKLIKRRLVLVTVEGPTPAPGTPLLLNGEEVGVMRSAALSIGLALVKLDKLKQADDGFKCGAATLFAHKPDWAEFPDIA